MWLMAASLAWRVKPLRRVMQAAAVVATGGVLLVALLLLAIVNAIL